MKKLSLVLLAFVSSFATVETMANSGRRKSDPVLIGAKQTPEEAAADRARAEKRKLAEKFVFVCSVNADYFNSGLHTAVVDSKNQQDTIYLSENFFVQFKLIDSKRMLITSVYKGKVSATFILNAQQTEFMATSGGGASTSCHAHPDFN